MSPLRILAFLPLIAGFSSSQTSDCSYLTLLEHLNLTTSDEVLSVMRPVKHWKTSTLVQLDMVLYGIIEVDEKSQTVMSHIFVQMSWTNEFLTWNPSDFCGIDQLSVPVSKLWAPDINIQEDASDTGSVQKGPHASLYPNGMLLATFRQRLTSTCKLKLSLFPFDRQVCNITFGSMSAEAPSIHIRSFSNDSTLTRVSEQVMVTLGEWELEFMKTVDYNLTKGGIIQSRLTYMVKIVRKPLLYVINFIVPLFYLLVLDLASFFISEARGEKMSFKVTILLSISVLLLILKDMLPSTEDQLPLIASYCVAIFALVGISVLEAMLVCFLTDLDCCCSDKAQRCDGAEAEIELEAECHINPAAAEQACRVKAEKGLLPQDRPCGRDLLKQILQEVQAARRAAGGRENDKKKPGFYRRVAEIIDSVFFVLYFITVVSFLTYMYKYWIFKIHGMRHEILLSKVM